MTPPGTSSAAAAAADSFLGTARFRPLTPLGRGNMGAVYRVWDCETETQVALKTLPARGADELYRLKQEFRTLAGIVHPNLVELYELIVDSQQGFFTMELVEGTTFKDCIARPAVPEAASMLRTGAPESFLDATEQLVLGLAALHAKGKLHRDVKPSNVLVTPGGRVVLLDFGLAAALELLDPFSAEDAVVGTPAYMAPELVWGKPPSAAADWYSVGVLLYETLTGRLPFAGPPHRLLIEKTQRRPPAPRTLVSDLPHSLDTLIMAMLDPEPQRRPQAAEILEQLRDGHTSPHTRREVLVGSQGPIPFVGRTGELAQLHALFDAVRGGQTALCHLVGPSGIGKSELLRRFVHELRDADQPPLVLNGRCHPQETVPYNALDSVIDALSRVLLSLGESELARILPPGVGMLTQVFPVLRRVPTLSADETASDAEPHEIRRRGLSALRALLARLSERQPLVVCIDDIQWGDLDSASVLRELLRPPEPPRMLVLLSYRDDSDVPLLNSLQTSVEGLGTVQTATLLLGPLDPSETHALANQLCAGQLLQDERITGIAVESAGSPYLVCELARHFAAAAFAAETPRAADGGSGALKLADLVSQRVQQLAPPARRVLEVISVAGQPLERSFALNVAGLGERGRTVVSRLAEACLVRAAIRSDEVLVEPYHHRISEALLAGLSSADRQQRHADLADAFEGLAVADPEALFRHSLGAGRRERAADWAVRAADHSADTLAFLHAAELYGRALELKTWDAERRSVLRSQQAEALVNAGRGSEAAPLYLAAASDSPQALQLELRRNAAQQFLVSGHIEEGVAQFRSLLMDLGLDYPQSDLRAFVRLLTSLVRLWFRGPRFRPSTEAEVPPSTRTRIDACDAAAKGLVVVDPIRGTYFGLQSLLLALRAGEIRRVGRGLCIGGGGVIPVGGPVTRFGLRLVEVATQIADQTQDPYLLGLTKIAAGQAFLLEGRWQAMKDFCDVGVQLLTERCRGVTWERDVGRMAALRAVQELGDIAGVIERAGELLREAEDTGDVYAQVTARLNLGFCNIASDQLAEARAQAATAVRLWTNRAFHLQHFYAMRVETYADLYAGDWPRAWQRIEEVWPALRKSNLLRHAAVRGDACTLRAHAALAAAPHNLGQQRSLLRCATTDARQLQRERRPYASGHAALIQAGIAHLQGQQPQAQQLLTRSVRDFEHADMALHAAYARHRFGQLQGADGAHLVAAAAAFIGRQPIRHPRRWLAVFAPGFGD